MQGARGDPRGHARMQPHTAFVAGEQLLAEFDEHLHEGVVAFLRLAQFLGEFATLHQDGQDAALLLLRQQRLHGLQAEVVERAQRVAAIAAGQALGELLRRQAYLVEHLVEQVGLVLEVPVDGATGHPGGPGDLFQAGMGHALFQEQFLGGQEDGRTGFFRIFLCASHAVLGSRIGLGNGAGSVPILAALGRTRSISTPPLSNAAHS